MRQLYPRSLLRLIILGNVLVALPLLVAIGYVFVSIGELTERSETLAREVAQAARHGYDLPEGIAAMDRIFRQYEVLGEPALLVDYAAVHREWVRTCRAFSEIPLLASIRSDVLALLAVEEAAFEGFRAGAKSGQELRDALADLKLRTNRLIGEANRIANEEAGVFRAHASAMRERLLLSLGLGLLMAVLFFMFSRLRLARVLWGFESAVQMLGEGRLDGEIQLVGPEDIREVGRRLDWLRRRLLALEDQRTLLLRHVSHELKTPLAALREGASLLTEGAVGSLTQSQEKIVGIMSSNALRLQALIDSLLKLQQAGYAGERIQPVALRLDGLAQEVLLTHQLAARNKRLRFTGALEPLSVLGGREELTAVVNNLVSNAIKYSPEGGEIELSLAREGDKAVLDVKDQGPGIPEAERGHVFEPFYRSSNAKAQGVAGVGLGLAIAREFVAAHRGTLELVDASVGAHFRLALPLSGETA